MTSIIILITLKFLSSTSLNSAFNHTDNQDFTLVEKFLKCYISA